MTRGIRPLAVLAAIVLLGADPPPVQWDVRQAANAPVVVTDVAFYREMAGSFKQQEVACVSFRVRDRDVALVRFRFSHRTADGTEVESTTLTRNGPFAAGKFLDGHPKKTTDDSHANCIGFTPNRADAPVLALRLVEAPYVDGTAWTAPPEAELPNPAALRAKQAADALQRQTAALEAIPKAPPRAAVPWDALHHAGYIAVLYGGNDPQYVAIFSPGAATPSTTLTVRCCAYDLTFLHDGTLAIGSLKDGIQLFAPGSAAPTKTLPGQGGFSLAVDARGDLAIGGYNSGPQVAVYPSAGEKYTLPGKPHQHDLAFAPDGELAVGDDTGTIKTYAGGSQTPNRALPFARKGGSLAYGPSGQLALCSFDRGAIAVYAAGATRPSFEVNGIVEPHAVAFDARGRLFIANPASVRIFNIEGNRIDRVLPVGGDAVAVGPDGTIVVAEWWRKDVGVYAPDGSRLEIPGLEHPQAVGVSP